MIYRLGTSEAERVLRALEQRRTESNENALRVADETILGVRARGDEYVSEQVAKFDRGPVPAGDPLSSAAKDALETAIDDPERQSQPAAEQGDMRQGSRRRGPVHQQHAAQKSRADDSDGG